MSKNMPRSVVALEFSPAYLKLVEFLPQENQIATVAVKPLDVSQWGDDAYLLEQIQGLLAKHVPHKNVDLVSAVAAEHAMLRLVEVPNGEDNVLDALQWDLEQYLTRSLDDYLLDYQAVGSNAAENGKLYLVAAYRRSEVERLRRLLESTGFPLSVLDIDAFAAINAFEANYPELQSGKTLLVKADAQAMTCLRVQNGMFQGYDAIPVDTSILELSAQAKTDRLLDLVQEVRARFEASQDAWGGVDQVLVCGDLALDGEFRELLESNLSVPLVSLNPFKEMIFRQDPEQAGFMDAAAQCAGVLGLALRRGGDC